MSHVSEGSQAGGEAGNGTAAQDTGRCELCAKAEA